MPGAPISRRWRTRLFPYTVSAAVLAAVLAPVSWEPSRDSFPLSSYPMFSEARGGESRIATVVGIDERGQRVILDPRLIGGTDEVILASATVWQAVAGGPESSMRLCDEVARRVAARSRGRHAALTRLEVVVERFDTVAYFQGSDEPLKRQVSAHCPVPREPA